MDDMELYKTTWNGNKLEDMTNSHLINTLLYIKRHAPKYKYAYEIFILDNYNYNLMSEDNFMEILKMNEDEWLKTTPLYKAIIDELDKRNLLLIYEMVLNRYNSYENDK